MPKNILVAGGAGFIGSHLCARLLDLGHSVVAVDNFITGFAQNIAHLALNDKFTLLTMDAADAQLIDGHFDLVMHFASPASPPKYLAHPLETLHSGSTVTEALLKVSRRDGARFILASTSEVYGDPLVHPQVETYWGNVSSIGPRSVYDEAKRFAEAMTFAYRRHFGTNTGVARIFNTYGPQMDFADGRAVPAFIAAALNNEPIPLFGDGGQTRSLCYIDDLIDGLVLLAFSEEEGPINLGNPHEQTVLEIAKMVVQISESLSAFEFRPRPIDDPERRRPDITKAQLLLGFAPKVSISIGLARTVEWFSASQHQLADR